MPYPVVVVTGDSIAQMSFRVGGYGAGLVDYVSRLSGRAMRNRMECAPISVVQSHRERQIGDAQ